jgi:hypothetical protein
VLDPLYERTDPSAGNADVIEDKSSRNAWVGFFVVSAVLSFIGVLYLGSNPDAILVSIVMGAAGGVFAAGAAYGITNGAV